MTIEDWVMSVEARELLIEGVVVDDEMLRERYRTYEDYWHIWRIKGEFNIENLAFNLREDDEG